MHQVRTNNRTDGKGQASPGPSLTFFRTALSGAPFFAVGAWLVLSLAAAGRFVFETTTVGHFDKGLVVGMSAIVTGILVGVVYVPSVTTTADARMWRSLSAWMVAGAAALSSAGVPWIVLANRYSDAPKGSLVLFWTAVASGAALWLIGALEGRVRVSRAAGALLAVAGAMGVLANWERPSSFSLLSRYANEQLTMGAAAVVWALCIMYLSRRVRADGWGSVAGPYALGSILPGIALLLLSGSAGDALASPVLLTAGCAALVAFLALSVVSLYGGSVAGSALVLVPVAVSSMTFVESALGMRGPRPLLAVAVTWASVACLAGVLLGVQRALSADGAGPAALGRSRLGMTVGSIALLLALVALGMPGVAVAVRGTREAGSFSADFTMSGIETVGGWLVLALACVVLAGLLRPAAGSAWRTIAALLLGAGSWWVLRFVPLHTWISWIPADIQQEYGTEYASIVFAPIGVWWQVAALVACGAGALVLIWDLYRARRAHA